MRVIAAASDLSAALKHSVAARSSTHPILLHTRLTTGDNVLHLESSDTEIYVRHTIPARVEEAGEICLTDALLRTIAGGGGDVLMRDDGIVQRGRSRFTVPALPANDFPAPEDDQFTPLAIDPEALRDAIRLVDYAYDDGDVRAMVRALHLEPGRVWSANHAQLGRVAVTYDGPVARIPGVQLKRLLPALVEGAQVLGAVRKGAVAMLRVVSDNMQVTVRCIDTPAPDMEKLVPQVAKRDSLRVNRRQLMDAVRRIQPFLTNATKGLLTIVVTVTAEGLGIHNPTRTSNECVEIIAADNGLGDVEMGISSVYLLAALGAIDDDVVELYPHVKEPTLILPDGGDVAKIAHVLMPCTI